MGNSAFLRNKKGAQPKRPRTKKGAHRAPILTESIINLLGQCFLLDVVTFLLCGFDEVQYPGPDIVS